MGRQPAGGGFIPHRNAAYPQLIPRESTVQPGYPQGKSGYPQTYPEIETIAISHSNLNWAGQYRFGTLGRRFQPWQAGMADIQIWITLALLGGAILFFITEWLSVDLVALGLVISLMVTRILSPDEALAGFSSQIVITIAALFIVGGAVMETGLADSVSNKIIQFAGKSRFRLLVLIMGTVALLSGFISDTGTVAVMAPAIISISRKKGINPSKLLIPLSFGSLLGGSMTLIGTPPNIVVSDLLAENGFSAFTFFDFTPIGLVLLISGILYIALAGRWLLPDRKSATELQRVDSPEELMEVYKLPEDLYRLRIRQGSPLAGKSLLESDLGSSYGVNVLEIFRADESLGRSPIGNLRLLVAEGTGGQKITTRDILFPDDLLICQGKLNDISHAAAALQLGVQPAEAVDQKALVNNEVGVAEVLLPPRSDLIGKSLVSARFGSLYQLTVLGINRPGSDQSLSLKDTALQFGDTLFVQGPWKNIRALSKQRRDFVVVGQPEALKGSPPRSKIILSALILAGMLIFLVAGWLPLATTAMIAAFLMIISGCLNMKQAYNSVEWRSILLIAGMLPMTTALQKVGLVQIGSDWVASTLGGLGITATLAALFLITSLFTQVISNTATTVLIAPVALSLALQLGYQPQAFLMTVALAASTAYATPVASSANTLVMASGSYRFKDYAKVGVPLILISMVISVLLLPLLWPLH
jgi:di/tricarboxylate transporter